MTLPQRRDFGGRRFPQRDDRPPLPDLSKILDEIDRRGYFDSGKKNVLPDVIQKWAEDTAKVFKEKGLTSTQLRRFYNKAKAIEQKLKTGVEFKRLIEEILTLKPLAAAAVGKKNAPEIFSRFMEVHVHQSIKSPDAFTRGFIIHLQSIIAYTKYFEERDKKGGR